MCKFHPPGSSAPAPSALLHAPATPGARLRPTSAVNLGRPFGLPDVSVPKFHSQRVVALGKKWGKFGAILISINDFRD